MQVKGFQLNARHNGDGRGSWGSSFLLFYKVD